jgi:hypothetical protein
MLLGIAFISYVLASHFDYLADLFIYPAWITNLYHRSEQKNLLNVVPRSY